MNPSLLLENHNLLPFFYLFIYLFKIKKKPQNQTLDLGWGWGGGWISLTRECAATYLGVRQRVCCVILASRRDAAGFLPAPCCRRAPAHTVLLLDSCPHRAAHAPQQGTRESKLGYISFVACGVLKCWLKYNRESD